MGGEPRSLPAQLPCARHRARPPACLQKPGWEQGRRGETGARALRGAERGLSQELVELGTCQPRFTPVEQLPTLGERAGAVPCRAVPRCAVLSRAMLCHIVPCRAVPRLLCHIAPCCAILCRAVPYCTVLCHTVPCRAVLYSTVPCRAVPCSAVPCRAVPRGWLLSPCRPPCAGAGSWLCLLEALRIPVLGSLAFKTSPGTEAVGSCNKQPKGSDDARAWR